MEATLAQQRQGEAGAGAKGSGSVGEWWERRMPAGLEIDTRLKIPDDQRLIEELLRLNDMIVGGFCFARHVNRGTTKGRVDH